MLYLIRFKTDQNGFRGWNYTHADNLDDARRKLAQCCGESFRNIDWSSLSTGTRAEIELKELEQRYCGLFD